eukprot:scaffold742_cov165-Amphora_coffeaeformis.AAC.10
MNKALNNSISTPSPVVGSNRWTRLRCSLVVVCATLFFIVSMSNENATSQETLQAATKEVVKPVKADKGDLVPVTSSNLRGESNKVSYNTIESIKDGLANPSESDATKKEQKGASRDTAESPGDEGAAESHTKTDGVTEVDIPTNEAALDHFSYCQATHLGDTVNDQGGMPIWYQCEGPKYDEFAETLHQFAEKKADSHGEKWGHRASPIPANMSVLFFGSEHTRQLALTLACQMGPKQVVDVHHFDFDLIDPNMAVRIRFRNGSSLYIVSDSYVAYSKKWQTLLEKQIEKPIQEFDLVAMGMFKHILGGSETVQNLKQLAKTLPDDYEIDLATNVRGLTPDEITSVYNGAFLLVSNSSIEGIKAYTEYRKKLRFVNRLDYSFIDQRQWMEKMHAEGAAGSRDQAQDATDDSTALIPRCVGKRGGHPDLISWDVSEFLHEYVNVSEN